MTENFPSPWWPCPECGMAEFRAVVMFERGEWTDGEDEADYEEFDPADGRPSAVSLTGVICTTCGHQFDIGRHYGWHGCEGEESAS